jgi:hypothetical protein
MWLEVVSTVLGWTTTATATVTADTRTRLTHSLAEVERAAENLAKGGKPFGGYPPPTPQAGGSRRESMPMMGGPRPQYEQQGTPTPSLLPPRRTH